MTIVAAIKKKKKKKKIKKKKKKDQTIQKLLFHYNSWRQLTPGKCSLF